MYQEVILDESRNPYHRVYAIEDPNKSHQFNPSCGDDLTLSVEIDTDTIRSVSFAGEGCAISISSASILAKLLEGKSVEDSLKLAQYFEELMNSRGNGIEEEKMDKLGDASIFTGTSKFPARIKCALLAWEAFKGALHNQNTGRDSIASGFSKHN
ncbi:MAG: SUF system NifU family Fe-S cluster assembly protein [Candidatus Ancillula sp.]|jgi:nitrogen fixation NifU-like protein|nr:SUF system NifU family Fe-S cluster assembly protein [Candidatus Ancillula sp.]